MSNILRTQMRASERWQRKGIDHRTGEVGPLRRGMTPLHAVQGSTAPGRTKIGYNRAENVIRLDKVHDKAIRLGFIARVLSALRRSFGRRAA
jgi:hypothetical protein